MKLRLAGTLVLVLGIAALGSASAYAGNGQGNGNGNENGNGNGKDDAVAASAGAAGAEDHGNSANAPGQLKKEEAGAPTASAAAQNDAGAAQAGVKPSNDTAHDTHAAASSDKTKLYGNGKTAGQIAIQNGAAPSTVLHGPGNSQPHKAAPCSGGHEVDVHALKGKRGKACGGQPPSPHPTPDPGRPGDPVQHPGGNTPAVNPSSPAQSTPAKPKPVVSPQRESVEKAAGVLSATGAIGAGTLPFTGFPIWVVVLLALALIVLGLMLRRRSRVERRAAP